MLFIHFKTLFSFKFYLRLLQLTARQTVAFVVYLFVVSVIAAFFFTGSLVKKNLPVFLKNFPQITFEKGVLTSPQQPVSAFIPQTDFKIVFDAAAQVPPTAQELLEQNTVAWVHDNHIYIPSNNTLQIQTLPDNLNFTSSPQMLDKYRPTLMASLRAALFITSLLFIALIILFNYCMNLCVVLFFNLRHGAVLSKAQLLKLSAFLLGPLCILWIVRLWVNIPLFTVAQLFVSIIYTQQIFNATREIHP